MGAGICIGKLPHNCSNGGFSKHGLQVYLQEDGTYDGYCFSCNTYVPNPYGGKSPKDAPKPLRKTAEQIQEEIKEIEECPIVALPDRKLRKETLEHFKVRIGVDQRDGVTPHMHFYPYTQEGEIRGYKARVIENKRMWSLGDLREVDLFGWEQAIQTGAKRIFITEGEIDAMSFFQIARDVVKGGKWAHLIPAVCSLPHGASGTKKDILRVKEKLKAHFKEIVFVPDMDEPGQEAAKAFLSVIPEALTAALPRKDVNECLMEGVGRAAYNAAQWHASKPKNTNIKRGRELTNAAKKKPKWGLDWPWPGLTGLTRGIRRGETYYFGAGVKMGKSEVVNALAANVLIEHDLPAFLIKPEEAPAKTYQRLVGKAVGRIFHDPKIPFDEEAFDRGDAIIGDKAMILDLYQFVEWDRIKDDIRYAVSEGVQDIFLDPITCFTSQMSPADANTFLQGMAAELSAMAKDLDFTAYTFCHLKAPTHGAPHEMGGKVLSNQFAGSRAMMRSCNYMFGIEGNKNDELPIEERNCREIVLLEDREFGETGRVHLYWNRENGLFKEIDRPDVT